MDWSFPSHSQSGAAPVHAPAGERGLLAIGAPVRARSGREQALVNGRSHGSHYSAARPRT